MPPWIRGIGVYGNAFVGVLFVMVALNGMAHGHGVVFIAFVFFATLAFFSAYSDNMRRASVDGVERKLKSFVTGIIKRSVETDRALRGRGFPQKVAAFDASGIQSRANSEIMRLAASHRALLDEGADKQSVHLTETGHQMAKATRPELFTFKPNFHGLGIDLKEAWRRLNRCFKRI